MEQTLKETQNLSLVLDDKNLFISELTGKELIVNRRDVFFAYIDPKFSDFGLDSPCWPTDAINFRVYELENDLTFLDIFKSLSLNLNKLVFTQSQIVDFCENHRSRLRDEGYALLFLTKRNDEFFVIESDIFSNGYGAEIYRLTDPEVRMADSYYVVVPMA